MNPLIFGTAGVTGQCLCEYFRANQIPYIGFIHSQVDITHEKSVVEILKQHRPDVVFNTAGMTNVDECETKNELSFAVNTRAPAFIASTCHQYGIHFIHMSTDYVFDGKKKTPYTEDDLPDPLSVYSQSKAEGEKGVQQANPKALIVRVAGIFRGGGKTFFSKVRELIFQKDPIEVVSDRKGNCTYAPDLVQALVTLAKKKASGIVHFTNEGDLSWFDFTQALVDTARQLGLNPRCQQVIPISSKAFPFIAQRPLYSGLDKSRYCQLTGSSIRHWQETLPDFLHEKVSIQNQ